MRPDLDKSIFPIDGFQALDNFSAHAIALWGREFPTAEHAFQWKKFSYIRPDIAERIFSAKSPDEAKSIAKASKADRSADWNERKVSVMEEILKAKVSQHADVRETLIETGERTIIENSPADSFWGIGPNKDGQNMVGKIWMDIRNSYMKNTQKKIWFRRKIFGWGWTPVTWQGWAVTFGYVAALIGLSFFINGQASSRQTASVFAISAAILTFLMIFIAYRTGEKPRWQWGRDMGDPSGASSDKDAR
ncbi:MAG TPA: NADAR family protein [Thermodesulfobacteriota bacterium]|nr:NADAR family protein [Candidatus Paceibacterota bacterium]HVY55368.1 NADAR family protein [Thermodesulfobacteriota bacterium]